MVSTIEGLMLSDLAREIFGAIPEAASSNELVLDDLIARVGNVAACLQFGGSVLHLLLNAALVLRLVPAKAGQRGALQSIDSSIRTQPIGLVARLELGSLLLGDLLTLKPGDVLATEALLARPLDLMVESGNRIVGSAHLGQGTSQKRALAMATTFVDSPVDSHKVSKI